MNEKKATEPKPMPQEFAEKFHLDRDPPVKEASRIIITRNGRLPAAYEREREAALEKSWEATTVSDAQKILMAKIEQAKRHLEGVGGEAKRYSDAGLPLSAELEERIVGLRVQLVKDQRAFSEGRAELEKLTFAARDHEAAARKALASALARRAAALGGDALTAVKGLDPDLLETFPSRTPEAAVGAFKEAQHLAEMAAALDPQVDVMAAFFGATTPALGNVISQAAGFHPPIWPDTARA